MKIKILIATFLVLAIILTATSSVPASLGVPPDNESRPPHAGCPFFRLRPDESLNGIDIANSHAPD